MRTGCLLAVACVACSPGFELDATIHADSGLTQNGQPITMFQVVRDFDSYGAAMDAPIFFDVDDGGGGTQMFDLEPFVGECQPDIARLGTVQSEDLEVDLTLACGGGQFLAVCFDSAVCHGSDSTVTVTP